MVYKQRDIVDVKFADVVTCVVKVKEWFAKNGYKKADDIATDRWGVSSKVVEVKAGGFSKSAIRLTFKSYSNGEAIMIEYVGAHDGKGIDGKGSAAREGPSPKDKKIEKLGSDFASFLTATYPKKGPSGSVPPDTVGYYQPTALQTQPTDPYQTDYTPSYQESPAQIQYQVGYQDQQYQTAEETGYQDTGYQDTSQTGYQEADYGTQDQYGYGASDYGTQEQTGYEEQYAYQEQPVEDSPQPVEETPQPVEEQPPAMLQEQPAVDAPQSVDPAPAQPEEAAQPLEPQPELAQQEPLPQEEPAPEPQETTPPVTEQPAAPAEDVKPTCPNCGKNIKEKWKTCPYCETDLKEPEAPEAVQPEVEQPETLQEPQVAEGQPSDPGVCPGCNQPWTWIPEYERHYCYNCEKYL